MKTIFKYLLIAIAPIMFWSCGQVKKIHKGNAIYRYIDNKEARDTNSTVLDCIEVYCLHTIIRSSIDDKTDFYIVKDDSILRTLKPDVSFEVAPPIQRKIDLEGAFYTNEQKITIKGYPRSFIYGDVKFGLQALSIPLKFRKGVGDGILNPPTVETGVNVGFAPGVKFTRNVFDPNLKVMGKSLNQYSITTGVLLNLGATELKKSSNAPSVLSDRKGVAFSYGTFLMFGVNNINFGYALGVDNLMGNKGAGWVYNRKAWHGVIISLDVLKF